VFTLRVVRASGRRLLLPAAACSPSMRATRGESSALWGAAGLLMVSRRRGGDLSYVHWHGGVGRGPAYTSDGARGEKGSRFHLLPRYSPSDLQRHHLAKSLANYLGKETISGTD
jgi:hypothetical protein